MLRVPFSFEDPLLLLLCSHPPTAYYPKICSLHHRLPSLVQQGGRCRSVLACRAAFCRRAAQDQRARNSGLSRQQDSHSLPTRGGNCRSLPTLALAPPPEFRPTHLKRFLGLVSDLRLKRARKRGRAKCLGTCKQQALHRLVHSCPTKCTWPFRCLD